jgi:hypothetical protein
LPKSFYRTERFTLTIAYTPVVEDKFIDLSLIELYDFLNFT